MIKTFFLIQAVAIYLLTGCTPSGRVADKRLHGPEWVFEGWACAPHPSGTVSIPHRCRNEDIAKMEYLYFKISASPSSLDFKSGNTRRMKAGCMKEAHRRIAREPGRIICEIISNVDASDPGPCPSEELTRRIRQATQESGVYNCCALDSNTGRCVRPGRPEDWSECMCIVYLRFPGGRKSFGKLVREMRDRLD